MEDAPAGGRPAAGVAPVRHLTAVKLLAAAALDLTRCVLAPVTVTRAWPAAVLVSAEITSAAVSLWTARGCQRGASWSGWAAFLIGVASAPQAALSGFRALYAVPDTATAALGVLVAMGVLTTAGRTGRHMPDG